VSDTMTPRDHAVHQYEALFHLDSGSATVNEATKAVRTNNPDAANVAIVAWAEGGVSVRIVQGKKEEPVQGWAGSPWRPVPTAIYRKSASGTVQLHFVVELLDKNASPLVRGLNASGTGVRITLGEGRSLDVVPSDDGGAVILKRSVRQ
jgi:hypothetical protein